MKNELKRHKLSYAILILFMGLVCFLFLAAWPDVIYQRYLILLMSVFYLFWGIVHHLKTNRLTKKVVLEYLGVAVLAGCLMFLITL